MGDWYEVVYLGGNAYIQYQGEHTDWKLKVIKIGAEHSSLIDTLNMRYESEMKDLLKEITDNQYGNVTAVEIFA